MAKHRVYQDGYVVNDSITFKRIQMQAILPQGSSKIHLVYGLSIGCLVEDVCADVENHLRNAFEYPPDTKFTYSVAPPIYSTGTPRVYNRSKKRVFV